jgi:transcriptional regulator with XRE-family HTH domain
MLDTKKILAENLSALLETRPDISRLNLSKQIQVADGTLGRIKYGTGNPTVEVIEQIARFFKIEPWQLLVPALGQGLKGAKWPFTFSQDDLNHLPPEDLDELDHQIRYKIERHMAVNRRGAA